METCIQKWGNSLGIRIPIRMAELLSLHVGSKVHIEIEGNRIVIQPPKYELDSMLKQINSDNQHHQIFDDDQTGNEEW